MSSQTLMALSPILVCTARLILVSKLVLRLTMRSSRRPIRPAAANLYCYQRGIERASAATRFDSFCAEKIANWSMAGLRRVAAGEARSRAGT